MKHPSRLPLPVLLLLALLFLAACSSEQPPAETIPTQPAAEAAGSRATPTNEPLAEQPTASPETAGATDVATMPPTEVAETEAPAVEPTAAPTAEAVPFNGQNPDGTFFRGAADAPVTMIDYSDFL